MNTLPPYADDSNNNKKPDKDDDIVCPAYDVCSGLGTTMSYCSHINQLLIPWIGLKDQNIDLHGVESFGDVPKETPDLVREDYQNIVQQYNEDNASREAIETHRVYMKLEHLQCCLASIVLLLSKKANP